MRSRTSSTRSATWSSPTFTPVTFAHDGPSTMQTRSSAIRRTLASGRIVVKRSGTSANSRSCGLSDELVGNRKCVVEDLERLVELLARDRQRRAAHDDVPVGHQVEPALERALRHRGDGPRRLACAVERHERLARRAILDELEPPEA